ncbi:hypothetical protein M2318_003930 [Metapseudomonas resinovorans]|uniref:hypothetical protein n=1 Tax=Metapseudomonas resinovorans TaxID=53412 RepID=UPI003D20C1B7
MTTLSEILSQSGGKLDQAFQSPWMQLGLNMLQAGGYQQNDPSFGQRLGQAGMGFMQQRAEQQQAQQLAAYRQQLIDQQRAALEARQAEAQREQQMRQQMQNPEFLAQLGPMARALAGLGADPSQVISAHSQDSTQNHRRQQLALQQQRFDAQARGQGGSAPKAPTPRQTIDEPLPDGMVQRHKFNAQTGQYEPFGAPFSRGAKTQKADPLVDILSGVPTENQDIPDTNAGPGPAVPGLPGTTSIAQQAAGAVGGSPTPLVMSGSVAPKQPSVSASDANAPATPQTQAEYDALPEGSLYVDPKTGGVFTKKARKARS